MIIIWGTIYTSPQKFENDYRFLIVSENLLFQTVFRLHLNAKPAFSNSSGLTEERIWQVPFSRRIRVDGRPNR